MIKTLYPHFQYLSEGGSIYLISDTHFEDEDCSIMCPYWPTVEDHLEIINTKVHKTDTLIHLGDVGNPEHISKIKAKRKILIKGNHDKGNKNYTKYFDEIYEGPLMIAEKIILSHEPIPNINWALNIHGHDHSKWTPKDIYHLNITSNTVNFKIINLNDIIKSGALSEITSLHRQIIDKAREKIWFFLSFLV